MDKCIVVGIASENIGIAIEKIRPINSRIAQRFFHEDENEYLNKQANLIDEKLKEL